MPVDLDRLKATIDDIADMFEIRSETARLEEQLDSKYTFAGIVARNPKMLEICSLIRRIAPYFKMVTIIGETGTGKEIVARALHALSARPKDPMVVCNCGGFVETLIESELFGHKQGSFTGAIKDKVGLFEAAGEGTLFLDEIGELPLSFQPHLLRVLQNGEFRSIGSHQPLFAKCRVIAATSKNLKEEVKTGKFREDLFYRVTPLVINIPSLRERKDDIPLLSRFFLGGLPDRVNPAITYYFGIAAMILGLTVLAAGPPPVVAVGAAAILGLGFSFPFASVASNVIRSTPPGQRGSAVGVLSAFYDLFVGTSSFAAGAVAKHWGYPAAFGMAATALIAAAIAGRFVFASARPREAQEVVNLQADC